jgi:hypothetical protein
MKHLKAVNRKAERMERHLNQREQTGQPARSSSGNGLIPSNHDSAPGDVVALQEGPLQQPQGHIPMGCTFIFSPGWEVDESGGTAGLCQPVERDLFDCHLSCFWPAQVPDALTHAPDWTSKCASAQKDWRKIDLIFP